MATARFRLEGRYDGTQGASVLIDRETNLLTVRPTRRKRVYTLRLEDIAHTVILRCVQAELREKKKAKMARRKFR
jgi:hypothetical protein